jgi:hypothetical protein
VRLGHLVRGILDLRSGREVSTRSKGIARRI